MSALVLIECEGGGPASGALCALQAAQAFGSIVALACGDGAETVAGELARMPHVQRVLTLQSDHAPRAEEMAPLLVEQRARRECTHICATASAWTRSVLPRAAALLDVMALSDVVNILDERTYVRPVHAGSALMSLRSQDSVHVLTIRASAFEAPRVGTQPPAPVESIALQSPQLRTATLIERPLPSGEEVDLIGARVVISGGRGVGSEEGFQRLRVLAKKLGAALGASRAAVDAGYAPADAQVGQTGKSVAPELYIAMGISGAVQHWAGMKDSRVIVAVNTDPQAPIFEFADYGLVADIFDVLPQLEDAVASLPPRA